jgi:hypothetical protein
MALPLRMSLQLLAFELNQAFIARTLCVNRDVPEVHCGGRCHLEAQMRETEEQERKTPQLSGEEHAPLFCYPGSVPLDTVPGPQATAPVAPACLGRPRHVNQPCFHPPTLA